MSAARGHGARRRDSRSPSPPAERQLASGSPSTQVDRRQQSGETVASLCEPNATQAHAPSVEDIDPRSAAAFARYTELGPLRELLLSGDVALVRASHLLELASRADELIQPRQRLPSSAFVDPPMLDRCFKELSDWAEYLRTPSTHPEFNCHASLFRFPPFVMISHSWRTESHPDPDGLLLRTVIAPAIEWYMGEVRARVGVRARVRARVSALLHRLSRGTDC